MSIKLTSSENRVIVVALLVAAASLAIGAKYFWRAFPEAAIDFRLNRNESEPLARNFLSARGARIESYRHAAVFSFDDETKVYLERTRGLERMNQLTRGPIRLWRWSHRWFKPQQKEEFRVAVSPAGEVVGYAHEIREEAPGANLDAAAARAIAEKFLREVMKRDLADLEFVETQTEKRPVRTDHSFTWKQKSVDLGDGSLRVEIEIDGNEVAGYREFVKIPEQWSRDYEKLRSRNVSAQVVDEVLFFLLTAAMLIILGLRLRDRDVPGRMSLAFGAVAAVLFFLGQLNDFSFAEFGYRTTDSYSSFVAGYFQRNILSAFGVGAWVFFLVGGSEPVYRENYPRLISLRRYLTWQGLRTRSFFMANVVGIALTFFFFAYQTVFYLAANKFGAWAPAEVNYSDLLNTRFPWVWVLFIGFLPAVSEEMQFRAFAIPFLRNILRSGKVALVLAAFIWGFLHSAYPNQPFFIRGIEVGVGGIVTGLIMLRFGILATLIWHYSVDALYTAFLLLRSHNHYLMVSGAVAAGFMLIPLIVALVAYWRTGTFAEETALTNAAVGVSRMPRKEAAPGAETALAYQPLSASRLGLAGVLVVVFVAVMLVPAYRFGKGVKLRIDREGAVRAADDFLAKRKVELAGYHRVAWIRENIDATALRYLLERRSVEESDQIYRQATRLALWQVRYFRPLQKEEHQVFVDVADGQVFNYRHEVDENAPGASLSPEEARTLAEKFLEQQGYRLTDFELQNSEAKKRKSRQDYTLTWQAKSGDARNVGDEHYRLEVDIAGDQVVGFARHFKIPEEWERERSARRLPNILLLGAYISVVAAVLLGAIILLVSQVRSGTIEWRRAAKVAVAVVLLSLLVELNQLPIVEERYDTSVPLASFRLLIAVSFFIVPLLTGLLAWVVVGLATSIYPDAWRVFRGAARRVWCRDAVVALALSLAVSLGLGHVNAVVSNRLHVYAPVKTDLFPAAFDAFLPATLLFLGSLSNAVLFAGMLAVVVRLVNLGLKQRAWWLGVGGLLVVATLGPSGAHSVREYLLGWTMGFVGLAVGLLLVSTFFRDNVLAYVAAMMCVPLVEPLISLLSQPAGFYRWNGMLLAVFFAVTLAWMFLAVGESRPAA